MSAAARDAHPHETSAIDCDSVRQQLDRLVQTDVSKMVLVTVESITNVAEVCPPDLRDHVDALAAELAGLTVDWVRRWPA